MLEAATSASEIYISGDEIRPHQPGICSWPAKKEYTENSMFGFCFIFSLPHVIWENIDTQIMLFHLSQFHLETLDVQETEQGVTL